MVGADGLHIWGQSPAFVKQDRDSILRAEPLMINFGGTAFDVTDEARPGNQIVLVDANNPVTLPGFGTAGPANIPMTQDMLTISSPVAGAATWVSSSYLNYSGTWDLAELDTNLQNIVQTSIENSVLTVNGRSLHIQLQSPAHPLVRQHRPMRFQHHPNGRTAARFHTKRVDKMATCSLNGHLALNWMQV